MPNLLAITLESHPFIIDQKNLKNETIVLPTGYSAVELVQNQFPGLRIVFVETEIEAHRMVSRKKADLSLSSVDVAAYIIKKEGLFNLKVAGQVLDIADKFRIGVIKSEPMLVQILNKVIQTLTREEKETLMNKYVRVNVTKGVDYTLVWQILSAVSVILFFTIIWIRRMAVMNRKIRIAQKETEVAKNSAEALVEKRTVQLRHAKEAAEAANQAKSDLLMNMNHELRTPLNAVLVSTAMITGNESEKDTIESNSYGLLETIDKIIDFTRSKDGNLELEKSPFTLEHLLKNLKTQFVYKGSKLNLVPEINTEGDPIPNRMIGDEKKLFSIINPLLENAAKFCRDKPKATLTIKLLEKTSQQITIQFSLKDNGIGIPKEFQEKIFEPFAQADMTSTREFDGTGMGLSLCKQLVTLMGGEIWVESEVEKGSTFYFSARFERQESDEYLDIIKVKESFHRTEAPPNEGTAKNAIDIPTVAPNLNRLNQALLESDPGNIRNHFAELEKYQIPKISKLKEAIDDYEYDAAVLLLEEIAAEIGVPIE